MKFTLRVSPFAPLPEVVEFTRRVDAAGIDGVYAAVDPGGRVIALLRDEAARTRSVVVLRPATL